MAERPSDAALLEGLRNGDAMAVQSLVDQYASRIYRLAYGITRNAADAEEVTQDVFVTLHRKIHTFEERSALGSWIYRIATNAALIKRRRGQRAGQEVSLDALLPSFHADGHRAGDPRLLRADWSQTPEQHLLTREIQAVVRSAIDSLPEPYRVVLLLRDIEGLSNEEVAKVLGESVAAVKSRLHRARMALRELLTQHFGPGQA